MAKKLSKRGRFLKKVKAMLIDVEELGNEALTLSDEDILWLQKKLEPVLDEAEPRIKDISRRLDDMAERAIPF